MNRQDTTPPRYESSHHGSKVPLQQLESYAVKRRVKKSYVCVIEKEECLYMLTREGKRFRNYAELKEDALRHLRALQCLSCGRTFGKLYSLNRHYKRTRPCLDRVGASGNVKFKQINPELVKALMELLKAKKEEIYSAAELCLRYFTHDRQGTGQSQHEAAMAQESEDTIVDLPPNISTQDNGSELRESSPSMPAETPIDLQLPSQFDTTSGHQPDVTILMDTASDPYSNLGGIVDSNIAFHLDTEASRVLITQQYAMCDGYICTTPGNKQPRSSESLESLDAPQTKSAHRPSVPFPLATDSSSGICNPDYPREGKLCRYSTKICLNECSQCLEGILGEYDWDSWIDAVESIPEPPVIHQPLTELAHQPPVPFPPAADSSREICNPDCPREGKLCRYPTKICLNEFSQCLDLGEYDRDSWINAVESIPGLRTPPVLQQTLTRLAHQPSVPLPPANDSSWKVSNPDYAREGQPCIYPNEACPNEYSQGLGGILDGGNWDPWVEPMNQYMNQENFRY